MIEKCYIVGAGDNSGTNFSKGENEYIIAADGGLEILNSMGIKADLIIGDFDSLGYKPKGNNVIAYKVEKDDTDMMLAVMKAIELGTGEIVIFGGTGGRIDHTFANIQAMANASKNGILVKMIDEKYEYIVITDGSITIDRRPEGIFSVMSISNKSMGVNIKGGQYSAKNVTLTNDNPTAVSNHFVGKDIEISVKQGTLLIVLEK